MRVCGSSIGQRCCAKIEMSALSSFALLSRFNNVLGCRAPQQPRENFQSIGTITSSSSREGCCAKLVVLAWIMWNTSRHQSVNDRKMTVTRSRAAHVKMVSIYTAPTHAMYVGDVCTDPRSSMTITAVDQDLVRPRFA